MSTSIPLSSTISLLLNFVADTIRPLSAPLCCCIDGNWELVHTSTSISDKREATSTYSSGLNYRVIGIHTSSAIKNFRYHDWSAIKISYFRFQTSPLFIFVSRYKYRLDDFVKTIFHEGGLISETLLHFLLSVIYSLQVLLCCQNTKPTNYTRSDLKIFANSVFLCLFILFIFTVNVVYLSF